LQTTKKCEAKGIPEMSSAENNGALRIAFLVSRFPSFTQTFILREILGLREIGISASIYSLKNPPKGPSHEDAKALVAQTRYAPYISEKVALSNMKVFVRRPLRYLWIIWFLVSHNYRNPLTLLISLGILPKVVHFGWWMRQDKIEHLHAHWATFPTMAALVIWKLFGIPYSFTGHASDVQGEYGHSVHRNTTIAPEKVKNARFVLTCSEDCRRYLVRRYANGEPDKIILNYHGIDVEKFKPINRSNRDRDCIAILSVGSLLECKGYPYLLEACSILKQEKLSFVCNIVGEGPKREELQGLIDGKGLSDRVFLRGSRTQDQLVKIYEESDIFVLAAVPEIHFGIPNVILEAMSSGLVVVVSALPAIPEIIDHGVDGLIVPEKDPRAIAETIKLASENEELINEIRSRAREKIRNRFDVKRNVSELEKIFLKNIKASRRPS